MPPDERADETTEWLARAERDLRAAQVDLGTSPPLLGDAAFHCQQAAEKALKALLTHHDHIFPRTHDLRVLVLACLEHDPTLEPVLARCVGLSDYAWRFRYPGDDLDPSRDAVDDAFEVARIVVRAVEDAVAGAC
jgi:HEPN domain-containing protein